MNMILRSRTLGKPRPPGREQLKQVLRYDAIVPTSRIANLSSARVGRAVVRDTLHVVAVAMDQATVYY